MEFVFVSDHDEHTKAQNDDQVLHTRVNPGQPPSTTLRPEEALEAIERLPVQLPLGILRPPHWDLHELPANAIDNTADKQDCEYAPPCYCGHLGRPLQMALDCICSKERTKSIGKRLDALVDIWMDLP